MKESGERIHERSQAIAVGNNNPCREMRRALSVDENQTHLIFVSRLPPRNLLRPHCSPRGCLNFSPIQEHETISDETNFVVKSRLQILFKNKYKDTPVKDIFDS